MKKISVLIAFLFAVIAVNAQDAKEKADAYIKNGSIRFESETGDVKLRVGTRFAFDGAYYFDDKTDLSSGTRIGEARIRLNGTFYKNIEAKFDIDFAGGNVSYKDIYLRYHMKNSSFFTIGHFAEPFSALGATSAGDVRFIGRPVTVQAFSPGRHMGIAYRYYGKPFWFETGLFGDDVYAVKTGDDSYGITGRFVYRPVISDGLNLQVGASATYRTAGASGVHEGDDDYFREIVYSSKMESSIDGTKFLNASVENATDQIKYGFEFVGTYKQFSLMTEFIGAHVNRDMDYQKMFEEQQGGEYSWTDIDQMKDWMGDLRSLNFYGYYVQFGWLIKGGDYKYNYTDAIINKPGAGALELIARYNYTNLNDVDGQYFNGKFYEDIATGQPNNSISGGVVNTYGLGLNYYWNANVRVLVSYNMMNLKSYDYLDKNIGVAQARLQIGF